MRDVFRLKKAGLMSEVSGSIKRDTLGVCVQQTTSAKAKHTDLMKDSGGAHADIMRDDAQFSGAYFGRG